VVRNQPDHHKPPTAGGSWFVPKGLEPRNQPCTWFGIQAELVRTTQPISPPIGADHDRHAETESEDHPTAGGAQMLRPTRLDRALADGRRTTVREVQRLDGATAMRVGPPRAVPISICRHPARARLCVVVDTGQRRRLGHQDNQRLGAATQLRPRADPNPCRSVSRPVSRPSLQLAFLALMRANSARRGGITGPISLLFGAFSPSNPTRYTPSCFHPSATPRSTQAHHLTHHSRRNT
jgi:hypothetical protein